MTSGGSRVQIRQEKFWENQEQDRVFIREVSLYYCSEQKNKGPRPEPWSSPLMAGRIYLFVCVYLCLYVTGMIQCWDEVCRAVTQFVPDIERKAVSYFFLPHPSIRTGDILCGTAVALWSVSSLSFVCSGTRFSPVWVRRRMQNRNIWFICAFLD